MKIKIEFAVARGVDRFGVATKEAYSVRGRMHGPPPCRYAAPARPVLNDERLDEAPL